MLFGTERVLNLIYSDLKKIEEDNDIIVVFGATVDGVAMGVTKYSSDLDLRFCFIYKDVKRMSEENYHDENKIRIQIKYEQTSERPYDAITLWEAHAFFHFTVEPRISDGFKSKLASIVYDTLCSPYLFDPYGLHAKLQPYFYRAFPLECEAEVLYFQLSSFTKRDTFTLADTLKNINKLMRLQWIRRYKSLPPFSSYSLLQENDEETRNIYDIYMQNLREWSVNQQKMDDRTKDVKIDKPIEVLKMIKEELLTPPCKVEFEQLKRNNHEVRKMFNILDDINTKKYPPHRHTGYFWSDEQ